jgi:hypothetical protein
MRDWRLLRILLLRIRTLLRVWVIRLPAIRTERCLQAPAIRTERFLMLRLLLSPSSTLLSSTNTRRRLLLRCWRPSCSSSPRDPEEVAKKKETLFPLFFENKTCVFSSVFASSVHLRCSNGMYVCADMGQGGKDCKI